MLPEMLYTQQYGTECEAENPGDQSGSKQQPGWLNGDLQQEADSTNNRPPRSRGYHNLLLCVVAY